jgi:hypothetical protein
MDQEEIMKHFSPLPTPESTGELFLGKPKYIPDNPQATLDLHGKTLSESLPSVEKFLKNSEKKGLTRVQIITGWGMNSEGGIPVLFPETKKFLKGQNYCFEESKGRFDVFFDIWE